MLGAKVKKLDLHGWVYGLSTGIVNDIGVTIANDSQLETVYQLNF